MKELELFKSLELSEEELRTLRLNDYFKPREHLLNHNKCTANNNITGSASVSTSTSVASNSHSNSMKKKDRKKFFTIEAFEGNDTTCNNKA